MKQHLQTLASGGALSEEATTEVFTALLDSSSSLSDAQIGAYLFATASRTPTPVELYAAAQQLRKHMRPFERGATGALLDTCGTGGSGYSTFNTSTAVALVCAAAGQPVAKHGNRAASSTSGSADVLEALGVKLSQEQGQQQQRLAEHGFVFLFAPEHHPATKRVALLRRELGLRTIFNYLGPLANPAGVEFQLMGVSVEQMQEVMAEALCALGIQRALVVRGREGLDELSCDQVSDVYEIQQGSITKSEINPKDLGIIPHSVHTFEVRNPEESAVALRAVLSGDDIPHRQLVLLNAAAALYVCGQVKTIAAGIDRVAQLLDSKAALRVLEGLQQS